MKNFNLKRTILGVFLMMTSMGFAQENGAGGESDTGKRVVNPQVVATAFKVDTLTMADRLAVKTNALDWFLLTPNIGVEFDVKGRNWNRWTVGLSVRGNWQTSHTYKPSLVYNLREVRLDGRQYWRTRQIGNRGVDRHKHPWDRLFSIRRSKVKHPTTTYYRGVYASYMDYSVKLGETGRQGTAVVAGVTYGIIRPMYAFPNGNSLDLEFGLSVGGMYTRNTEYTHDAESNCYPVKAVNDWHLVKHPVVSDLTVGLVYRFGRVPVTSKYRYRCDVDIDYSMARDSVRDARENRRIDKKTYDDNYKIIIREFWHVYDSVASSNYVKTQQQLRQQRDEQLKAKAEEKAARAEKKQNGEKKDDEPSAEATEPGKEGEP